MPDSEQDTIRLSDSHIHYKWWRPRSLVSSIPVVLMHESLGCVRMWREFPQQLADRLGRTVLAYDRLGFGRSSGVTELPGPDFVRQEANDIFPRIRQRLGLDDFIIYGHSIGGAMAVEIAARFRNSCIAVITEAALPFVDDRTLAGVAAARKAYEDERLVDKLRRYHGDKTGWVLSAWTDAWFLPEFAGWNLFEALQRNQRPLLAIHGERDEYGSVNSPETMCSLSGGEAKMHVIPHCGHAPHREATRAVLDSVERFLHSMNG